MSRYDDIGAVKWSPGYRLKAISAMRLPLVWYIRSNSIPCAFCAKPWIGFSGLSVLAMILNHNIAK